MVDSIFLTILIAILVIALIPIVLVVSQTVTSSKKVPLVKQKISEVEDFNPTDTYISDKNFAGIAIDAGRRQIVLATPERAQKFTTSSIIACEVLQDDAQLAYANRGSQLVGVAVGGVLLGGVGAVIGGLSGSKRNISNVKKITLRFVTDDFHNPNHDVVLFDFPDKGLEPDHLLCKAALKTADLWHSRMRALMQAEA